MVEQKAKGLKRRLNNGRVARKALNAEHAKSFPFKLNPFGPDVVFDFRVSRENVENQHCSQA